MTNKKNHFQDILNQLNSFEEANKDWICSSDLFGWNEWSILKKSLYYSIKNRSYNFNSQSQEKTKKVYIGWFVKQAQFFSKLGSLLIFNRGGDAIITATGNKLSKDEEGYYEDPFIDPLIKSGVIKKYVYIEYSSDLLKERKSKIIPHLKIIQRNPVIILLDRSYAGKKELKAKADFWAKRLNSFFQDNHFGVNVNNEEINGIFSSFFARYKWYLSVWKILKPKRLFTVDAIPDGAMAAARSLKIKTYEFQHGIIASTKPDYIITSSFVSCKNKMVLPDYVCVFGEYFKNLLLKNSIWTEQQIISLGSYVIAKQREVYQYNLPTVGSSLRIIWITQPTMFSQIKEWLEGLTSSKIMGIKIALKKHPLEPVHQSDWYNDFVENNSDLFEIEEKSDLLNALTDKHLLVGFHSTSLLEALSMGVPVVTICTDQLPMGINSMLNVNFSEVIKPVQQEAELRNLLNRFKNDSVFAENWSNESYQLGSLFFAKNYYKNVAHVFNHLIAG